MEVTERISGEKLEYGGLNSLLKEIWETGSTNWKQTKACAY